MTEATLRDPDSAGLLEAAREFVQYIFFAFWTPQALAEFPGVWQWRKLDFLDWLRPLEKLLRRILLTEAIALSLSQSLPAARRSARPKRPAPRRDRIELAETDPASWPCVFRVTQPMHAPARYRARKPEPYRPGEPPVSPRYRRVLHDPRPLALRLEAVIRLLDDPGPRIRRLAFALARTERKRLIRILLPPVCARPMLSDTLERAGVRCAVMMGARYDSGKYEPG